MFFNSLGWSRGSSIFSDAFSNNTSIYLTWFVQLYGLLLILSYIYFHNNFPLTNRKPRNQTAIDHSFIWPVSFNQWAMWTGGLLDTSHTYWPRNKNHIHNLYFIFRISESSPSSSGLTRVMSRVEEVVEDRREILLLADITRLPVAR